jgi:hypothetical protein
METLEECSRKFLESLAESWRSLENQIPLLDYEQPESQKQTTIPNGHLGNGMSFYDAALNGAEVTLT